VSDNLKAFPIVNAKLATSASVKTANTFAYPGMTPAVSATAPRMGSCGGREFVTGGVTCFRRDHAEGALQQQPGGEQPHQFGSGNKFITPMEVNGMVFVGTPNGVAVFGLLP